MNLNKIHEYNGINFPENNLWLPRCWYYGFRFESIETEISVEINSISC